MVIEEHAFTVGDKLDLLVQLRHRRVDRYRIIDTTLLINLTVFIRQFIGEQTVEFSTDSEKNVTVLIGVNTSGKTTLIRAFEWILYNKNGRISYGK